MKWWLAGWWLMAGCGRIAFDPIDQRIDGDGGTVDVIGEPAAFVQIQAPPYASAPSQSVMIDLTAGHLVVAAVYWDQTPNTVTLADTAGLTWTAAPKYEIPAVCGGSTGNATGAQLYYAQVSSPVMTTVTVSQTSGAQPLGVMLVEYAGLAMTNVVEAESGQVAPSASNAMFVPSFTTTRDTMVVVFFNETLGSGTMTEGSGYTARARITGFPNMYEDALLPPGMYIPSGALPAGQTDACWVGDAIALRTL
jgi:hypothetical protein